MLIDIHLVLIPILLAIAALFAAAEAALFTLSPSQLETLRESRPQTYRRIRNLIFQPDSLLSTIIIGNECLNIMIGTFVVALVENSFPLEPKYLAVVSVLVTSILLLTFSEILPKVLAFRLPVMVASVLVYPISWIHVLVTPLRKVFLAISERIIKAFGIQPAPPPVVNEKDFLTLVEVGAESGTLEPDERARIMNVFSFSDLSVSSIMTPWNQIFTIQAHWPIDKVLSEVKKQTFSRIPVVSSKQEVVGILYTKELLKLLLKPEKLAPDILREAIFPPYIVSTHKKVSMLFRELKVKKVHIALVVDEYGRHLGIVTLEDVLNALFQTQRKEAATR